MAYTALKDVAVGSIVKLNESGSPVEFYVACHDYESGLNGTGRTLLVRKGCCANQVWNSSSVNAYASSTIDTWLNGDYKSLLDTSVQEAVGTTAFYCTVGNGDSTVTPLTRSVFMLSLTEIGYSDTYANVEGSALPIASTLKASYSGGSATTQWTRSPNVNGTGKAYYLDNNGNRYNDTCSRSYGIRPAFTISATATAVDDDNNIVVNALLISGEDADLGEKSSTVTLDYVVATDTGNTITVTERVGDTIIRTYVATSGDTQTINVNLVKFIDESYTLNITAEMDGMIAERNYTFTVPAITLHNGGTVQEFQDNEGNPVFPATHATAVITSEGKSVERTLLDLVKNDVKIQTGSYIGTGTFGASNPCSITFDFEPKVFVLNPNDTIDTMTWVRGMNKDLVTGSVYATISWNGKTVSWYTSNSQQMNTSGTEYYYCAIG